MRKKSYNDLRAQRKRVDALNKERREDQFSRFDRIVEANIKSMAVRHLSRFMNPSLRDEKR